MDAIVDFWAVEKHWMELIGNNQLNFTLINKMFAINKTQFYD